jgi:hypothetical protein
MDFTVLLLLIFMLLALQQGLWLIAGALFLLILFTTRGKALMLAVLVGAGIASLAIFGISQNSILVIAGLFVVFLVLARKDERPAGPEAYYPGGGAY